MIERGEDLPDSGLSDASQTRFVIIGWPRTGSTHLTSLLNQQDGIACHGEVFHPKNVFVRWRKEQKIRQDTTELLELRERDPDGFLDRLCAISAASRLVGFKIFSGHNDAFLAKLIADAATKKVVLYRANLLASYSSSLVKRETPKGVRRSKQAEAPRVKFDAKRFEVYGNRHSAFFTDVLTKLNAAGQSFFMVHYEQINDPWLLAGLINFIGADSRNIVTKGGNRKLNSSAILSRFSNADEAAEYLRTHDLMGWQHETTISLDPFGSRQNS